MKLNELSAIAFFVMVCLLILGLASGCSTISSPITEKGLDILQVDIARTNELANKYNSPAVAQCTEWLGGATAGIRELADEPTSGIFSSAFKAALLRRLGTQYEELFAENCGGVAARMLVELGRRAPIPGR